MSKLSLLAPLFLFTNLVSVSGITISTLGVNGYTAPGYVISADSVDAVPATNRHTISTLSNFDFGSPPATDNFSVTWSLLDPGGVVVANGPW